MTSLYPTPARRPWQARWLPLVLFLVLWLPLGALADMRLETGGGGVAAGEGIDSGTDFPATPSSGDLFLVLDDSATNACDSDAGAAITLCRWDGANWVAVASVTTEADTAQSVNERGSTYDGANSLATATGTGNGTWSLFVYVGVDNIGRLRFCLVDQTVCTSMGLRAELNSPIPYVNEDGDECWSISEVTGLRTFSTTNNCAYPTAPLPFDASWFDVLAECTIESVAHNGWPAKPILDCAATDTGTFALVIDRLPPDFVTDGAITLQLSGFSITAQSTLTLVVHVGAPVCTADNEQLAAFSAPTGNTVTLTFGATTNERQDSNTLSLTATGCAAGEEMRIAFATAVEMTAAWTITDAHITGGLLTYEQGSE